MKLDSGGNNKNNGFNKAGLHIAEFLSDPEGLSDTEIREELTEYDTAKVVDKVKNMVQEALERDRLAWQEKAKLDRGKTLSQMKESWERLKKMKREQLISLYHEKSAKADLLVAFRDFDPEKVDDDEIRDMLMHLIHLLENRGSGE